MTKPELSDEETPRTQLERFFSALQRLARTGDKALLRANAKTRERFFARLPAPATWRARDGASTRRCVGHSRLSRPISEKIKTAGLRSRAAPWRGWVAKYR